MRRARVAGWAGVLLLAGMPLTAAVAEARRAPDRAAMDRDLMEVTVPKLEALYRARRYTVAEVTQWYLDRIERYDGTYRTMLTLQAEQALHRAVEEDQEPRHRRHGALWGVPIVVKGNTSVVDEPNSAGFAGFLKPGHVLVAPKDATVVRRLRAAGAVILGETNLPEFAASDTTVSTAGGRTGDAYDVRFSPGGSSGGTATAVAANFCVLGTGTDTANSIRQPAANDSLVGFLPTRGLVSIAGIEPLDWLRDNTGPLARDVTDAAIALGAMQGPDPLDAFTKDSDTKRQAADYLPYLKPDALQGKRFAVPWFILEGAPSVFGAGKDAQPLAGGVTPETRAQFLKAVEQLRAAGATVLMDKQILPESFLLVVKTMDTQPYRREGVDTFLKEFGPADFHSVAEWERVTGDTFPSFMLGAGRRGSEGPVVSQVLFESDPEAEMRFWGPQRQALELYTSTMQLWHLDGYVYPALQEPTFDEVAPGSRKDGPHSQTDWVNRIGVPAVSVPGGFYPDGLPFGLEISGVRWKDGDLLGYAYAYEQATKNRRLPVLVEGRRDPGAAASAP